MHIEPVSGLATGVTAWVIVDKVSSKRISLGLLSVALLGLAWTVGPLRAPWAQGQEFVKNPGFEGPAWQTNAVGTSVSSWLGADWQPWSVLGDQIENREVEYKLITLETSNSSDLRSHVRSGKHSQQFFTNGASHTAGFYQKIQVPPNSQLTFAIWVQMQTGQNLIYVDGRYVSDLAGGGGNYYAQVGIDPTGATPAAFGAPLPASVQWSEPLWDISAYGQDEKGNPADLWVPISISAQAQGAWITVYTSGKCKYPTKYNSSFWDDASLTISQPPTPTPRPPTATLPPTATALPTETPLPTETSLPTETPLSTATSGPTSTPTSAWTATALPSATPPPTKTLIPTPSRTPTPTVITDIAQKPGVPIPEASYTPVAMQAAADVPAGGFPARLALILTAAVLIFVALAVGLFIGRWLAQ